MQPIQPGTGSLPLVGDIINPLPPDEQPNCSVRLYSFGSTKVRVIKIVRELTGLGLWESKALVESAPVVVLTDQFPDEASAAAMRLREVGAAVDVL